MTQRKTKTCRRCGVSKQLSEFNKAAKSSDGLHAWCRQCVKEDNRRWWAENPDEVRRYNAARRAGLGRPGVVRVLRCEECGEEFEARRSDAVVCARRCGDRRYRRLHPEQYREKQRRYYLRRREREAREA